jgi:hypothetical protein
MFKFPLRLSRHFPALTAFAFVLLCTLVTPECATAQIGTTTEIITGRVVGPDSLPLNGARVEVTSVETGVVRRTLTKADGRFSILFRDGGAQYRVRITYIGMVPATVGLTRQADEDRLVVDVRMGRTAVQLSAVQVRANAARAGAPPAASSKMRTTRSGSRIGSGRSRTAWTTVKIARLAPMPSTSVSNVTATNPGARATVRSA